jgi:hypothetical protein
MIKLNDILVEGGKLFGGVSERVSTEEMNEIFKYLKDKLSKYFVQMELSKSLPTKKDHGDVDILVQVNPGQEVHGELLKILKKEIPNDLLEFHEMKQVKSMLFKYNRKIVQVDFIIATDKNMFTSVLQYYQFNDISGIIGIFSKKLHFSYGQHGFTKTYDDSRNNRHFIYITNNLMDGLKILGLSPDKFKELKTWDDMVDFMLDSPLMDKRYFAPGVMNQSDRKSTKRPVINYVVDKIRESTKRTEITDEDYFFKKLFPKKYELVENKKKEIEKKTYVPSKYNGDWIMKTFHLEPGKRVGEILKHLSDKFGTELDNTDEEIVKKDAIEFYGGMYK